MTGTVSPRKVSRNNKKEALTKSSFKHARVRSTTFQMTVAHGMYYIISDSEMAWIMASLIYSYIENFYGITGLIQLQYNP